MAHLQYSYYPGVGEEATKDLGYKQAVRIGDKIECSGQGGWWPEKQGIQFPKEINEQIDQAFKNVDLTLKTAGGQGWSQVYRVNSYHLPLNDEALQAMARNFKKWMPDHQPIWTAVGVARLGADDMRVEIEVAAHIPNA
ncbi:hypothetical protein PFICI_10909 [Pestalotiopsis fici W106-1]|uniref:Uncharacterized protein n=1 Tax=Pestalotiopsis fici (strain W106-1 / CGMCC3.15140) TaxID=1229662 RepID=W3WT50_PESFW|nr:uncharacterized protein PFICI_10909 [Pestalotiopsis fici W106-1]ETS77035.1 hypothetical protein PFICI_10909 [Pestalotiopsis fici W106-1]